MATFVRTRDIGILIDPGAALGPFRRGLTPHRLEIERLSAAWSVIKEKAASADVFIITHYHYDHHNPQEPAVFRGKELLIKDPERRINRSQRLRARYLLENIRGFPERIEKADGRIFAFGGTRVQFSDPVYHSRDRRLGFVIQILVAQGNERFLFTSDIHGAANNDCLPFITRSKASKIYMDGPPGGMTQQENLKTVLETPGLGILILDHHNTRDLKWRERCSDVLRKADTRRVRVLTAAEFMGVREEPLEALRESLYAGAKPQL
jgi:predicted metallo-beta-lactamase superfamily hydrolase